MFIRCACCILLVGFSVVNGWSQETDSTKQKSLFNGKDLAGWTTSTDHWQVVDGVLVAEVSEQKPLSGRSNLVLTTEKVADFELTLQFRITGHKLGNGGILFRSQEAAGFHKGYHAGLDQRGIYVGSLRDAMTSRGTLATRGQAVNYDASGERKYETFASLNVLEKKFRKDDWNDYKILAQGNRIVLELNGERFAELHDHDAEHFDAEGALVLQLAGDDAVKIEFRKIQLTAL